MWPSSTRESLTLVQTKFALNNDMRCSKFFVYLGWHTKCRLDQSGIWKMLEDIRRHHEQTHPLNRGSVVRVLSNLLLVRRILQTLGSLRNFGVSYLEGYDIIIVPSGRRDVSLPKIISGEFLFFLTMA